MTDFVITEKVNAGGDSVECQNTLSETDEGFCAASASVADEAVDQQCNWTCDKDQLKAVLLWSDQDLTVETNAIDATGGNTINLKAGIPYIWYTDSYHVLLLTENVAVLYLTNASGATASFKAKRLEDSSP